LITIKIERNKTRADFASVLAGPRLAIHQRSDDRRRDHSWTHIEQVGHQGALPLDAFHVRAAFVLNNERMARCVSDMPGAATELCAPKNDACPWFLSRRSRLINSRQQITQVFLAFGEVIQLPLSELILVSGAMPSRAHSGSNFNDGRLSRLTLPHLALTSPGAGNSGDRLDLPADDWTVPSTAKPVAAAAMGSVAGSLASEEVDMRGNGAAPQREQKN
jgi:hypothetical protein